MKRTKITVYMTETDLRELEDAVHHIRRDYGVRVNRGRVVREALRLGLADLDRGGLKSTLLGRVIERAE